MSLGFGQVAERLQTAVRLARAGVRLQEILSQIRALTSEGQVPMDLATLGEALALVSRGRRPFPARAPGGR